jgi:hypothetical protein
LTTNHPSCVVPSGSRQLFSRARVQRAGLREHGLLLQLFHRALGQPQGGGLVDHAAGSEAVLLAEAGQRRAGQLAQVSVGIQALALACVEHALREGDQLGRRLRRGGGR